MREKHLFGFGLVPTVITTRLTRVFSNKRGHKEGHVLHATFVDLGSAPPEELAGMAKKIPAGYIGGVQDAVQAVRYFLSDDARGT